MLTGPHDQAVPLPLPDILFCSAERVIRSGLTGRRVSAATLPTMPEAPSDSLRGGADGRYTR